MNLLDFYDFFKPDGNENKVTSYPLIIGGTGTIDNLNEGVWVVNLISGKILTRSYSDITKQGESYIQTQHTKYQTTYQLDFYKAFASTDTSFVIQDEVIKMREYLNSSDASLYLANKNCEVLPVLSTGIISHDLNKAKKMINRATLEFDIIENVQTQLEIDIASAVNLNQIKE